jgi:hypothetical protein
VQQCRCARDRIDGSKVYSNEVFIDGLP